MTLVLGIRVILILQECDQVFIYAIIMQFTALLSPVKSPQTLCISPRSQPWAIRDRRMFRGSDVRASASADLRVSAAARRGAAAYGVASRCFWKARMHGCLLSESGGERSEDGTLCRISR